MGDDGDQAKCCIEERTKKDRLIGFLDFRISQLASELNDITEYREKIKRMSDKECDLIFNLSNYLKDKR